MSRPKPEGALVRITYDPNPGDTIEPGDVLRTKTGRAYVVMEVRPVRQRRSPFYSRLSLRCVVAGKAEIPADARVFPLYFYSRDATRPRQG